MDPQLDVHMHTFVGLWAAAQQQLIIEEGLHMRKILHVKCLCLQIILPQVALCFTNDDDL